MITIPVNEANSEFTQILGTAAHEEVLLTRGGRPAAILIGFENEDDYFDYQLENDERFLRRIEISRRQAEAGRTTRIEDLPG